MSDDTPLEGRFKYRVDSMAAMQSMVRKGLGVTNVACYVAQRDESLRRAVPEPLLDSKLDFWILHHPDIRSVYPCGGSNLDLHP